MTIQLKLYKDIKYIRYCHTAQKKQACTTTGNFKAINIVAKHQMALLHSCRLTGLHASTKFTLKPLK